MVACDQKNRETFIDSKGDLPNYMSACERFKNIESLDIVTVMINRSLRCPSSFVQAGCTRGVGKGYIICYPLDGDLLT